MVTESTARSDESENPNGPASSPALSFDQLPLSDEVRAALRDMGYEEPTDVQVAVWEPAAANRDVVVQARTGTGKTAAFGLPIVDRLIDPSLRSVQVLILCPTRELALQVSRELDQLGAHKSVKTVAVYGGASMPRQVDALASGVPIVAGTPGRVLDHLKRGTLDPSEIRTLVLDESDEMLSMGFEKELTAIMERLPEERQTMLFSATLPPDIERMVRARLDDPEFVLLSGDHIGALEVSHYVYMVTQDKLGALVHILEVEDPDSAVIFCNTREQTETVALGLQKQGFNADWLNGDLPQSEREKVMAATREGKLRFMVATDVAARGIDISHLSHVINYDFPQDAEGYVHRTGRTGRAGRTGYALSLVTPQDIGSFYILRLTYGIRPIERSLPSPGEQRTRLELDVVKSLVSTFAPRGRSSEQRQLARRLLTHAEAEAVIAGMLNEYLKAHPGMASAATTRRREWTPPPTREARERGGRRGRRERSRGQEEEEPARTKRVERRPAPPRDEAEPRARRGRDRSVRSTPAQEPSPADGTRDEELVRVPDDIDDAAAPAPEPKTRVRRTRSTARRSVPTGERSGPMVERNARPTADDEDETLELYVNVGRKDGARIRDLKTLLIEEGGLPRDQIGRVRIRDRCSFVEVATTISDEAIEALSQGTFGDRAVQAAISERSARGSSQRDDD